MSPATTYSDVPEQDNSQMLSALRTEREALLKKLQNGGRDAHSRIRLEKKAALATAAQIRLELQLGRSEGPGR